MSGICSCWFYLRGLVCWQLSQPLHSAQDNATVLAQLLVLYYLAAHLQMERLLDLLDLLSGLAGQLIWLALPTLCRARSKISAECQP